MWLLTFSIGAALPLLVVVIAPAASLVLLVAGTSLFFLALLGALAAQTDGARILAFSAESERPT